MIRLTPIVMLHYVSDEEGMELLEPWNISRSSFLRLLDFIGENGYRTVGFEDKNLHDPAKSIIITFDDCPKHLWEFAIPELIRRNMKAVFYISTAYIGGIDEWNLVPGAPALQMMDEDDIKNLVEAGMEVGSHAHRHIMLGKEQTDIAFREIAYSKQKLEEITGREVVSLAYPYGCMPKHYRSIVRQAGFAYSNGVFPKWENSLNLRRWIFSNDMNEGQIAEKLQQEYKRKRKFSNPVYLLLIFVVRLISDFYFITRESLAKIHRHRVFIRFTKKGWYMGLMELSELWADSYCFNIFEEVHLF